MPVKIYKPTSPGRRQSSVNSFADITKFRPEKSLIQILKKNSGRNNQGRITVRHQGGGVKQFYRLVDFRQQRYGVPAKVLAIEYDPNRSTRIALAQYDDMTKTYLLAPEGVGAGATMLSSDGAIEAKTGNRMPLQFIPIGVFVYNIELTPGKDGQLVRSAGISAQLVGVEGKYA